MKYFSFRPARRIDDGEFVEIDDPLTKESLNKIAKDFSVEVLLRKLRELIFTDKTLSNRVFFVTKKDFLKFSINLLDLIDEETAKENLTKAKRFILSHKFLYLLS